MLIEGLHLFPLDRADAHIAAGSYFMDAEQRVYSMRTGKLVRITGSVSNSGTYFKLVSSNSRYGRSVSKNDLARMALRHPTFKAETSPNHQNILKDLAVKAIEKNVQADRHHAKSIDDGIKGRGWLIGQVVDQAIIFGSKPAIHTTQASVDGELTRLATKKPGTRFVKLKIEAALTLGAMLWE